MKWPCWRFGHIPKFPRQFVDCVLVWEPVWVGVGGVGDFHNHITVLTQTLGHNARRFVQLFRVFPFINW